MAPPPALPSAFYHRSRLSTVGRNTPQDVGPISVTEENRTLLIPGAAAAPGSISQDLHGSPVEVHAPELSIREERDRSTIGRPEGI